MTLSFEERRLLREAVSARRLAIAKQPSGFSQKSRRGFGTGRGRPRKLTSDEVASIHKRYVEGAAILAIARELHENGGFSTIEAARTCIYKEFRLAGYPVKRKAAA